jgi:hypothetical protein
VPSALDSLLYSRVQGDALEQYDQLRWGRAPGRLVEVRYQGKLAQDLVALGELRALVFEGGRGIKARKPFPWLAVGAEDNRLYVVGGSTSAVAKERGWGTGGSRKELWQIHYSSIKGRGRGTKSVYWFHDFEPQRPVLHVVPGGWPEILGGDYFVADAGIVG